MKNVIIIGAGVVGVASAYFLRQKGFNIKVLDAAAGPGMMTSFANGAQLSYSKTHPLSDIETLKKLPKLLFNKNTPIHIHPGLDLNFIRWGLHFMRESLPQRTKINADEVLKIAMRSREALHAIVQKHEMNFDYVRSGKLYIFTNKNEFQKAAAEAAHRNSLGIEQKILTATEALALEPALSDMVEQIAGAIYSTIDESGDAKKFTEELAKVCVDERVEFKYGVKIDGFKTTAGKISAVTSGEEEFAADDFVIALGVESPKLLKKLGIYLPIYPMKGYSLTMPAGELAPRINITNETTRVVFTKIGERLRIAGIAEFAGYNHKINQKILDNMVATAQKDFPRAGDYSQLEAWTGLRPMTPSTVPIIAPITKFPNLYLNTGHGMLGWTLACGSAEKLANILIENG